MREALRQDTLGDYIPPVHEAIREASRKDDREEVPGANRIDSHLEVRESVSVGDITESGSATFGGNMCFYRAPFPIIPKNSVVWKKQPESMEFPRIRRVTERTANSGGLGKSNPGPDNLKHFAGRIFITFGNIWPHRRKGTDPFANTLHYLDGGHWRNWMIRSGFLAHTSSLLS